MNFVPNYDTTNGYEFIELIDDPIKVNIGQPNGYLDPILGCEPNRCLEESKFEMDSRCTILGEDEKVLFGTPVSSIHA